VVVLSQSYLGTDILVNDTVDMKMHVWRRKWRAAGEADPSIPAFEDWIKRAVGPHSIDVSNPDDMDVLLMCTKPSQKATRYTRMKAFGNHFRVEDDTTTRLHTYDSGVASVFQVPVDDARDVSVNYVGVVKDILKLDYGAVNSPVILLRCEWVRRHDNRGNPTYIRDEAGFLFVNFRHKMPKLAEPFIFPSQATQVFYSDDMRKEGWKVVLRSDARARREVADTSDVFITTTVEASGLTAPSSLPPLPGTASLVGAIELSTEDNLLASATF
jgi:hypothetical protein